MVIRERRRKHAIDSGSNTKMEKTWDEFQNTEKIQRCRDEIMEHLCKIQTVRGSARATVQQFDGDIIRQHYATIIPALPALRNEKKPVFIL